MENENKGATRVEGNKTPRLTFSVSREFESILPEIESMPNMSRFVCEAIYEKLQRTKNPNKDLEDALSHFVQIQSIIGRPVAQEPSQPQWIPPVQPQNVPSSPSSIQQVDSSGLDKQEERKQESISPVEVIADNEEHVVTHEAVAQEVIQEEVEEQKTVEVEPIPDTESKEEEDTQEDKMIKTDTESTISSSSVSRENPEKNVALKEARKNFLKPRTS